MNRTPITAIAAYLISSHSTPWIAIHRGKEVRFYGLTPASCSRLEYLHLSNHGEVWITMHGWSWHPERKEDQRND